MSDTLRILVVDDNRSAALAISMLLQREGHTAEAVYDGQTAIARLGSDRFDLVLTDLRMEPIDGLAVVAAARACDPPVEAIVFTAYGSVEAAVEAMRLGALDFLTKPVTADVILRRVRDLRREDDSQGGLIGDAPATRALRQQADKLARVRSTVLITGEIGTGRRHLARWLHHSGLDSDRPLLLARPGRPLDGLEDAGTLLIPSVDTWDHTAQGRLQQQLELLEPGSPPRVIATACPDLEQAVSEDRFRPDLYFRLAVLVVPLLPLRQRPEDIGALLQHFLDQRARALEQEPVRPLPHQLRELARHPWPGNARELANLAERAAVLGESALDLPAPTAPLAPSSTTPAPTPDQIDFGPGFNLSDHMEEMERALLIRAIEETGGDRPQMSKILGLERNTLRYKLNKYKLLDKT